MIYEELYMPGTEEKNRLKSQIEALRVALDEDRKRQKALDRAAKDEQFSNSNLEEKENAWKKVEEKAEKLSESGAEAYRKWITCMMEIVNLYMDLGKALRQEKLPKRLFNELKNLSSAAIEKLLKSDNANIDPHLSVELFDKDGKPQIPTLHAKDDLLVKQEIGKNSGKPSSLRTETKAIFKEWLEGLDDKKYGLHKSKDDKGNDIQEIGLNGENNPLTPEQIDEYKAVVEDQTKGFAVFLEGKLHEAGFKQDFNVSIYEQPPEPTASPSAP